MYKTIKIIGCFFFFILAFAYLFIKIYLTPKFIEPLKLNGILRYDSVKIGEKKRDFYLYHPNKKNNPNKLIIAFHPATENGIYMRKITGYSLDSISDKENIFVCYPNAYDGYWNDQLTKVSSKAATENVNETLFINAIVNTIENKYHVEIKDIYLIGLSQGGVMTYRLCLDIPNSITAATIVAANLPIKKNRSLDSIKNSVSMLIINGKKDPVCPYNGGEVNFHNIIKRGDVYSATTTIALWAKCAGYDQATLKDSLFSVNHTLIADITHYNTVGKKTLCLYGITDGGHTFPHPEVSSAKLFGNTNHDLNAATIAWLFFKNCTVE